MRPRFLDFGKFAKINGFDGNFFGADFQTHFQDFLVTIRGNMLCRELIFFVGVFDFSVRDFGDKKRARTGKHRGRARTPTMLGASRRVRVLCYSFAKD